MSDILLYIFLQDHRRQRTHALRHLLDGKPATSKQINYTMLFANILLPHSLLTHLVVCNSNEEGMCCCSIFEKRNKTTTNQLNLFQIGLLYVVVNLHKWYKLMGLSSRQIPICHGPFIILKCYSIGDRECNAEVYF